MKYLLFLLSLLILPAAALAQTATGTDPGTGFVPLSNIPFIQDAGNALNLQSFLNNIYRICIGLAAALAVLQIMRAGIMYMGGDSVTEKKEAKNLIAMSIGGLVLVLSPVIVFSIINPEILSLKIDASGLTPKDIPTTASTTASTTTTGACQNNPTAAVGSCPAGRTQLAASCCTGLAAGSVCCSRPTTASTTPPATQTTYTYKWRMRFQPTSGAGVNWFWREGGPFTNTSDQAAKNACVASLQQFINSNPNLQTDGVNICNCNSPANSQQNCLAGGSSETPTS